MHVLATCTLPSPCPAPLSPPWGRAVLVGWWRECSATCGHTYSRQLCCKCVKRRLNQETFYWPVVVVVVVVVVCLFIQVPFVDVKATLLDSSHFMSSMDYEEFGQLPG